MGEKIRNEDRRSGGSSKNSSHKTSRHSDEKRKDSKSNRGDIASRKDRDGKTSSRSDDKKKKQDNPERNRVSSSKDKAENSSSKRVDQVKIMMKIEAKKKIGYINTVANQIKPRKIPTRGEEVNLRRKLTEKKKRDVRIIEINVMVVALQSIVVLPKTITKGNEMTRKIKVGTKKWGSLDKE